MMKNVLICVVLSILFAEGYGQEVMIVAHRGASHLAPENTTESIQLAWELGAPAAECDIMLTADKQVIVFHDKTGKRLTGHDFVVSEVSYDEIKDYPIALSQTNLEKYQGATIPLLSEVLHELPPGKMLVIEIKTGPEILPYLGDVLAMYHSRGKIAFIAFDFETINAAKEMYPGVPCYYLSMFRRDVKRKFEDIVAGDLDGVDLRHGIVSRKLVDMFSSAGKDVWCWTVNDRRTAKKMADAGVSAITTNRPKWILEE